MHRHGGDFYFADCVHRVTLTPDRRACRDSLRTTLRERRRSLSAPNRIAAAEALAGRLLALSFMPTRGYVAGYWAHDGEIGLHAWQLRLPPTLQYCLPVLQEHGRLRFAPWNAGNPLVTNRFGIPEPDVDPGELIEPAQLAMVIVPLVGFDAHCQRLGMGGGYYDRSFTSRQSKPAPPWLVGAAFALQQVSNVHAESWDVPLDAVCCEDATYMAKGIA